MHICATNAIDDERHCVFHCPHLQGLRQQHVELSQDSYDTHEIFKYLLSCATRAQAAFWSLCHMETPHLHGINDTIMRILGKLCMLLPRVFEGNQRHNGARHRPTSDSGVMPTTLEVHNVHLRICPRQAGAFGLPIAILPCSIGKD